MDKIGDNGRYVIKDNRFLSDSFLQNVFGEGKIDEMNEIKKHNRLTW